MEARGGGAGDGGCATRGGMAGAPLLHCLGVKGTSLEILFCADKSVVVDSKRTFGERIVVPAL